jgi:hypothetical protein
LIGVKEKGSPKNEEGEKIRYTQNALSVIL